MKASIPKKIIIIPAKPQYIEFDWDDFERKPVGELVNPAFVTDAENEKTIETGRSWAEHKNRYKDDIKQKPLPEVILDNNPIKDVQVVGLEKRAEGGRAWKVIVGAERYYFDFREDILLDSLIEEGSRKGGFLNGSFLWARVGSQMKLVRIGSELHKELLKADDFKKLKKIGKDDLEVGGIYQFTKDEERLFVGFINTLDFIVERRGGWSYDGDSLKEIKRINKAILWVKWNKYQNFKDFKDVLESKYISFEITTSNNAKLKTESIELPSDAIELLRQKELKYVRVHTTERPNQPNTIERLLFNFGCYDKVLCMSKYNEEPVMEEEFKKIKEHYIKEPTNV